MGTYVLQRFLDPLVSGEKWVFNLFHFEWEYKNNLLLVVILSSNYVNCRKHAPLCWLNVEFPNLALTFVHGVDPLFFFSTSEREIIHA